MRKERRGLIQKASNRSERQVPRRRPIERRKESEEEEQSTFTVALRACQKLCGVCPIMRTRSSFQYRTWKIALQRSQDVADVLLTDATDALSFNNPHSLYRSNAVASTRSSPPPSARAEPPVLFGGWNLGPVELRCR